MTVEEFKIMFLCDLMIRGDVSKLEEFVSNISVDSADVCGDHFSCIKIREQLLNRKDKRVKSELVFLDARRKVSEMFLVSIQSTVNSLDRVDSLSGDASIKYDNFSDLKFREATKEDAIAIYAAMSFKAIRPDCNHLLSDHFRMRTLDFSKHDKEQNRQKIFHLEEVGETELAV